MRKTQFFVVSEINFGGFSLIFLMIRLPKDKNSRKIRILILEKRSIWRKNWLGFSSGYTNLTLSPSAI
jgi:hypothetical protein